ncbi:hypothetical protein [Synoicihabitans lomoniglobus]|uniref:Uncharacterized protein n=1 Tax=Synoicihabitans lomoniglobus TaxID=2909285 RepID=A0AAF0CRP1_9BACT|nr:hypothetical protein [Opitutaceae bacterium LMO-M01]WED66857.1 hypothetical protein PXH66_08340 [Opitutaceae bacterium LMO-M01]
MNPETEKTPPAEPTAVVTLDPITVASEILDQAPKPQPGEVDKPATTSTPPPADSVEKDSGGVVFDESKHNGKKHPKTGRWLPRGGRPKGSKNKKADPVPAASAWSDADRAAAASPSPSATAENTPSAPSTESIDSELVTDADDAAEVAVGLAYMATGMATGEPSEARLKGGDHTNFKRTLAAYFKSKGWHLTGVLAVGVACVAYLLKVSRQPKTEAKFSGWMQRWKSDRAKPVEKVPATPPRRKEPATPPSPSPSVPADPYAHIRS